jgi:hypothetical protein
MKTSHFTAMIIAACAAVLLAPTAARAGHDSCTPRERLIGYHSCGAPIYLVPRICGYHPCGAPRYSWKREIRHSSCRCRNGHHHYGSHRDSAYGWSHRKRDWCSNTRYRSSGGSFRISFGW